MECPEIKETDAHGGKQVELESGIAVPVGAEPLDGEGLVPIFSGLGDIEDSESTMLLVGEAEGLLTDDISGVGAKSMGVGVRLTFSFGTVDSASPSPEVCGFSSADGTISNPSGL